MALDAIVLIGMSVAAYKRARRSSRNPLLWVAAVWLAGCAMNLLCVLVIPTAILAYLIRRPDVDFEAAKVLAFTLTRLGVAAGGFLAVAQAGKPKRPRGRSSKTPRRQKQKQ